MYLKYFFSKLFQHFNKYIENVLRIQEKILGNFLHFFIFDLQEEVSSKDKKDDKTQNSMSGLTCDTDDDPHQKRTENRGDLTENIENREVLRGFVLWNELSKIGP